MKNIFGQEFSVLLFSFFSLICAALLFVGLSTAEEAPQFVIDLAQSKLKALGSDPIIVQAVKMENSKAKSINEIKKLDAKWKATPGITDYMTAIMESDCGRHLRQIQEREPYLAEIFVMDNQGANVAMTDKTSDFWQGDEAKFIQSFNSGAGNIFVDDVEFDESSQSYLVQVSVPVMEGGKAIGAITFGIDLDEIE